MASQRASATYDVALNGVELVDEFALSLILATLFQLDQALYCVAAGAYEEYQHIFYDSVCHSGANVFVIIKTTITSM